MDLNDDLFQNCADMMVTFTDLELHKKPIIIELVHQNS